MSYVINALLFSLIIGLYGSLLFSGPLNNYHKETAYNDDFTIEKQQALQDSDIQ
jgi:hypothetical protein